MVQKEPNEEKEESTYECVYCGAKADSVANLYSHFQSTDDDDHAEIRERIQTAPSLTTVVRNLQDLGVVYIAASKPGLPRSFLKFFFHFPPGADGQRIGSFLEDKVADVPSDHQLGVVNIDNQPRPATFFPILRNDLHLYRRVPVHVDPIVPGLGSVEPSEGIQAVRDKMGQDLVKKSHSPEICELENLVQKLVDAGAKSVELQHELLPQPRPPVQLRIPAVPANVMPIVGPIDFVEANGELYRLQAQVTMDGPRGPTGRQTPIYMSDKVAGCDSISVEKGMEAVQTVLRSAKVAETVRDIEAPFSSK